MRPFMRWWLKIRTRSIPLPINGSISRFVAVCARGDLAAGESAFSSACVEMKKVVDEQPDYAEALSVLGMSEAALGRKQEALFAARRAVDLFPVAKDAITGAEILRNLAITYAWAGEKD